MTETRQPDADTERSTPLESPHSQSVDDVLGQLEVDAEQGLTQAEARRRRKQYGANQLRKAKQRSVWRILVAQFTSVVLLVLGVAAVGALFMGEWPEAAAIGAVFLVNGLIGFFSEWKAVRSMEALRAVGQRTARVRRDGEPAEIKIEQLVPGDIVAHESGDVVPADLRLIESNNLRVDEAALTGESVPVNKQLDPVEDDAPLAERFSMIHRGTVITDGSGEGVVVATGMRTELGRIAEMAEEAESDSTPLQERLNQLGARLAWLTLSVAVVIALIGVAIGRDMQMMIATAIALGLAAVPEGLPIVSTIALARGMWRMAKRQALINRLTAVETLGATQVIFTDKTGTLTQNRMTLRRIVSPADDEQIDEQPTAAGDDGQANPDDSALHETPLKRRILETGVLCSNAVFHDPDRDAAAEEEQGDPTELALVRAGAAFGLWRDQLLERLPEAREVPFDSNVMMMGTFHEEGEGYRLAVKGAPSSVLEVCTEQATGEGQDGGRRPLDDEQRQRWIERSESLAEDGFRMLALADRRVEQTDVEPYESLRFLGLAALYDPPADGVADSIAECRAAGVRVVMVTGDQPATARAIGKAVGVTDDDDVEALHGSELKPPEELSEEERQRLLDVPIFARVSPEQKLNLVKLHQEAGHVVAMTGDGINDAPALKKATIGVAMGKRGTDAAREAAEMVLKDDAFQSIVAAVEQGRIIFGNIRKSVMFMLCTNVAEVLAVSVAAFVGWPLPLRPLQILYLNVLTDVFPALALGVGEGDPAVMKRPPRPADESVLTRRHWAAIGAWAALIATCVLAALLSAQGGLGSDEATAVTISFLTLGLAKLWFVFNLSDWNAPAWNNDVVRNRWIWGSIALCLGLLVAAVYTPGLTTVLKTQPPGPWGWTLAFSASLVPLLVGLIARPISRLWKKKANR